MNYYDKLFVNDIKDKKLQKIKYSFENNEDVGNVKIIVYYKDAYNLIEAVNQKYFNEILCNKDVLVLGFCKNNESFKIVAKDMFSYFLESDINLLNLKEYFNEKIWKLNN